MSGDQWQGAIWHIIVLHCLMSKTGNQKRPWGEEQDRALKALYESTRLNKWSLIAEQLASEYGFEGRTGKQCRERYNNHLDPALNREDWAANQEKKLFQLHDQLGNKWAIISHRLGVGRTDNSVKNHFFSKLRKSLRRLNKIIQEDYKREIREIQTKVLYKILEACEEKFKPEPMCDAETSEAGCHLKNKILNFSYLEEEPLGEQWEQAARELIQEIITFNKNYKRKPKKFRRTSTQNYDTLEVPRERLVKRAASNDSFSNSSHSFADSKSDFGSQDEQEDDIHHPDPLQHPQQKKIISPIIVRTKSQPEFHEQSMMDQKYEHSFYRHQSLQYRREVAIGCESKLQQLGLLEELDAAVHPFLMKKQTSLFSRRSSDMHEEDIKFFEDSEIEMRILFAPLPQSAKKESFDEALFHE